MLSFILRGRVHRVNNVQEASTIYAAIRDKSGAGASTFPAAIIRNASEQAIAVISYNGKVWALADGTVLMGKDADIVRSHYGRAYAPGAVAAQPLFDPTKAA
jgi:hypothetical protein